MPLEISEEVIFFNPVYTGKVTSVSNDLIKNEIIDFYKNDSGRILSNVGGWQSNDVPKNLIDFPEISKLILELMSGLKEVYDLWGFYEEPILDNFWFNINKKNSFNIAHTHPGSKFSAVYYVECNEKSGRISFARPDLQAHYFFGDKETPYTYLEYSYLPEPYQFIFFPSFISHHVGVNDSDNDRISIAFNFK